MMRRSVVGAVLAACFGAACVKITDNSTSVLSIQFDSLPSPSVVLGDSLRDTTGAVVAPTVHAFNYQGEAIASPSVRFYAPDPGVSVDSITGVISADSLRSTPARIVATVGELQAVRTIDVTLSPDLVVAVEGRRTLEYSRIDTTDNVSDELTVKVTHGTAPADSAVRSYIVSFAVVSGGDPRLAELVSGRTVSPIDTTDVSGVAGRAVRIRPLYLLADVDSVIVNATVKYRGTPVAGSPVRLVVVLQPVVP
jgi:hypothetical protein